MVCIATKEKANVLSNASLYVLLLGECDRCAMIARELLVDRKAKEIEDFFIKQEEKEMKIDNAKQSTGQVQFVNADPKASTTGRLGFSSEDNVPWTRVRTSRDLSFLISDKSGESTPVVVKDVDSKTLHDMLDIADEIVISRVDAK